MGLGGTIEPRRQTVDVRLLRAYTGITRFPADEWNNCRFDSWVVDIINTGRQRQRIGGGRAFARLSGVAALYAPGRDFHEWRTADGWVDESYIVFDAGGATAALLRKLSGPAGWRHFRDRDRLIADRLKKIAELAFCRRIGYHLAAHGLMAELLGILADSHPVSGRMRALNHETAPGIAGEVERYIRQHIARPIRVADLAAHVKMSLSAFAHAYPPLAGEPPYRTVQRLKVEAAKRLMLQDGLSVKQCAARLGIPCEFHLSRLFKRLEGLAPKNYIEALLRKK
ncbi:MAG: helix-turn-helix transcriptional regulator [Planctomycetes bacterium]|nr:helix-turn-helix transcriptional regulator [Planctomycetota bacterium]